MSHLEFNPFCLPHSLTPFKLKRDKKLHEKEKDKEQKHILELIRKISKIKGA